MIVDEIPKTTTDEKSIKSKDENKKTNVKLNADGIDDDIDIDIDEDWGHLE